MYIVVQHNISDPATFFEAAQAGWHDYFEQVNARGELLPPPEVLGDMVQLQRKPA